MYVSTCCQEPHSASTSPCSQTREVAPRGTWSLPPRPGGPAPRATRQRGKCKQVYCRPPGPPPHTAAEAPAGHGLDPALWTSLTLASDLNIWQQADKGCSGNSLCRCQQPHPLQALQGVFTSTLSPSSSGPPAPLSFLSLCFSQSLSPFFLFPSPFPISALTPSQHPPPPGTRIPLFSLSLSASPSLYLAISVSVTLSGGLLCSPLIFCLSLSVVSFCLSTLYPKPSLMILSLLHFSFWVSSLFVPCPTSRK